MKEIRKCLYCEKEFETNKVNRLYCSSKCRNVINNRKLSSDKNLEPVTKKCLCCGKEFKDNVAGNKFYCSGRCKRKHHYKGLSPFTKNCLYCWKEFTFQSHGKEQVYCSSSCRRKYFRKYLITDKQKLRDNELSVIRSKTNPLIKYSEIKLGTKYRKKSFNISYKYFLKNFWNVECTYCGKIIEGGGIDRVDSSIGYEPKNCVPCCSKCNRMKNNLSLSDFFSHIQIIINHTLGVSPKDSDEHRVKK